MVEVQGKCSSSNVAPAGLENALSEECSDILSEFKGLIVVRYLDHVLYNRTSALVMKPQIREAVGWLVYECEQYVTLTWDRDAEPPTLKRGDPKASGLVVLKTNILELKKLFKCLLPLKENSEWHLNSPDSKGNGEFALQSKKRKTQEQIKGEMATT
jgi:hypothetical protein